jgi:hypothetical protein
MNTQLTRRLRLGAIGLASLFLLLALAACSNAEGNDDSTPTAEATTTSTPADEIRAAYEAARDRWEQGGIDSYEFMLVRNCFCPEDYRGPFSVTVENGVVTEALYQGGGAKDGVATTVDEVFDEIERALDEGVLTEITYDPTTGHPLVVRLDLAAIAADGGLSLEISNLTQQS